MDCLGNAKVARHTKKHNSQLTTHTNTMHMPTTMVSAAAPYDHLPMELRPPNYTNIEEIASTSCEYSGICLIRSVLRRRPTYAITNIRHKITNNTAVTVAAADALFHHLLMELRPQNYTHREEIAPN
jgi:hypothetical protein